VRCLISLIAAAVALGQQMPFIPLTGPNAPKGASFLFEDKVRGGLWLGGVTQGEEGLTYFDGSRFVSPFHGPPPKAVVSGIEEDTQGGIWLATSGGVYRASQGRLELVVAGAAIVGLVRTAPDVFLVPVAKPWAINAGLVRVKRSHEGWVAETVDTSMRPARLQTDRFGSVLYACPEGYCEFSGADAANWHAGISLQVVKHRLKSAQVPDMNETVLRDRFDCVWRRSVGEVTYLCPGDEGPVAPEGRVAGLGFGSITETEDGSIVIPSYAKLAVGRPGNFHVINALNGNPGAINVVVASDGGIWLNSGNGLFVFPTRLRMEFWTEREGLGGNTWSILRTPSKTFSLAGDEVTVLSTDRRRWDSLALGQSVDHLIAGSNGDFLANTFRNGTLRLSGEGKVIGKVDLPAEETSLASVKADPQSGLWTCSDGVLVHKAGEWKPVPIDGGSSRPGCLFLAIDHEGGVWYGDANFLGAGFGMVEGRSGDHPKTRHFVSGDEIGNATVRFLGVDRRGWIWRGSPIGVYVADPEQARQSQWLYLNRLDGIAGTDANRASFFSDPDGSVWFGLDNSINHLYPPDDLLHPTYAPSVFISGYSWNGGPFQMADMVSTIQSRATLTAHIGSLQFDRRNALRLRYRLLPDQPTWRETKSLDLPLGVLPSGAHTLEVQGRIFTGPWSHSVRRSFSVLSPIWLTPRFFLFYLLAAALLFTSVYLLRRNRRWEEQSLMPDLGSWRLGALMPESHDLLGTTLDGRYEVGDLLARGGFASVMSGYDRVEQRPCAIKIFRGEVKNKASILRGFEQEVAALRQIRHPNVVSIYADGLTPSGAPYLAMEFVAGKNLRDIVKGGPLPGPRAARLLEQLAHALDAIHQRAICHRDVKPENVIVRHNGSINEEAVLIDFSIAIIKDANETLHGLSRAAGTFDYMAPEQALGHAQPSSDIFSLAKVAIEMLTGERLSLLLPNAALDLPKQTPTLLAKFDLKLSVQSVQMLAAALQFDPAKRPNIASEFILPIVRDLKAWSGPPPN
jgi:hypothetical protein